MTRGTVRYVSPRGAGFIRCEDNTDIYFCRPPQGRSDTLNLKPGQAVEFEVTRGRSGRQAVRLRRIPDLRPAPSATIA